MDDLMGHADGLLTISQLAATTGVSVHAIRNYVVERLIPRAGRTNGGSGLFDSSAIERLSIIRAAREGGLPLQAIRPLLHALNAKDATAVAANIEEVECMLQRCRQQLAALSSLLLALKSAAAGDLRSHEAA